MQVAALALLALLLRRLEDESVKEIDKSDMDKEKREDSSPEE
jgi:hypothetical protein